MLDTKRFHLLSKLPGPLLTAYLKTGPDDLSVHPPVPSCLACLKKEANSIAESLPANECELFRQPLRRLEEFLRDRTPRGKSLVVFAGPEAWETVELQIEVANELHWGKAAMAQLLWLAAEHKPYCFVIVDRSGAQFLAYRLGEFSQLLEVKFNVDISQWRRKDRGPVARPGIRETHGAQRDVFEHRMDAQYRRLCREVAEKAIQLCRKEQFSAVFLVGSERLATPIGGRFPEELYQRVVWIPKDLGKVDPSELQEHLKPEIERWEREHELNLVNELLGEEHGAVLGIEETLSQLQKGRIRVLVLCRELDARLHRCMSCGWTSASAGPVCGVCRGERTVVALRDVLPELAAASEADLEVVSGDAADRLKEAGGMGAWLRQPKPRRVRRVLAHA
jgi:Bacterial archaeo-eukaryotic release factor family 10